MAVEGLSVPRPVPVLAHRGGIFLKKYLLNIYSNAKDARKLPQNAANRWCRLGE